MIDEMAAGAEMDRLVAEEVMGWRPEWIESSWMPRTLHNYVNKNGVGMIEVEKWHPSTDIAAAWDVVEKFNGDFEVRRQNDVYQATAFVPSHEYEAWAETAPLAICRAALRAVSE